MKKTLLTSLLAAVLCIPAMAHGAEKSYELAFTSEGYRENHVVYQSVWKPWMELVAKKSNGRLNIVFYSPGSICSPKDVPDAIIKRRAEIGHSLFGANPGMYGYSDIGDANVSGVSSLAASMGFSHYVNSNDWVKSELDNKKTKLLSVWATGPMMVCSNSPITKVSDFKNRKINYHISGVDKIITTLGAVPVMVSPPDIYMSVQRGQTNTTFMALSILKPFKLYEVFSDILNYPMAPGYHYMFMNREAWDELPADLQKILEETTGEIMSAQVGKAIDAGIDDSIDWALANKKVTLHEFSSEEKAKMQEVLSPFREQWITSREKKGFSRAREALSLFTKAMTESNERYGK